MAPICVSMRPGSATHRDWPLIRAQVNSGVPSMERDGLGDNLVPDYITAVREGGFYGWPWWYMGPHQDPRHAGKHPELRQHVITPDVLLQPHSAPLQLAFYQGEQFPVNTTGTSSPLRMAHGTRPSVLATR